MGGTTPGELRQPSSARSMALASSGGSGMLRLKSVVPAAARQLLMFLASGTRGTFSVAASGLMPFWCLGRGQGSREGVGPVGSMVAWSEACSVQGVWYPLGAVQAMSPLVKCE